MCERVSHIVVQYGVDAKAEEIFNTLRAGDADLRF